MTPIESHYPEFVPNQILTDKQLNQLHAYLDSQSRATRTRLVGAGVVCGLTGSFGSGEVTLTGGFGVSSEGYLIEAEDAVYTHVRAYADPDVDEDGVSRYWRTTDGDGNDVEITVRELLTGDDAGAAPLQASDLAGHVLVLYLEELPQELGSCLVADCSDKGFEIHLVARALLIAEADLEALQDTGAAAPVPVRIPRFHTVYPTVGTIDGTWAQIVRDAVADTGTGDPGPLVAAVADAFATYGDLVGVTVPDLAPIRDLATAPVDQDRYGAVKDLAAAVNEAVAAAWGLVTDCGSSGASFARHLMLGAHDGTDGFRHELVPSPVHDAIAGERQRVERLFKRLAVMIGSFDFGPGIWGVVLTPSRGEEHPLGRRAVPYYYGVDQLTDDLAVIWQDRTGTEPVYSYGLWDGNPDPQLGRATFVRIEGHLGLTFNQLSFELGRQREESVDFAVQRVDVGEEVTGYLCDTEPVRLLWATARNELLRLLAQLRGELAAGDSSPTEAALVQSIADTEAQMPASLEELVFEDFRTAYKKTLADLRHHYLAWKAAEITAGRDPGLADGDPATWPFLALGGGLLARIAAIAAVFAEIRATHAASFDNLMSRFDGVEHLAGVRPGGTFVVVCDGETVVADFALPGRLPCCCEVDPTSLHLPPAALPDHRIVTLDPDGSGNFQEISLDINVVANDYDPQAPSTLQVTEVTPVAVESAEATLAIVGNHVVRYNNPRPTPGLVDRFSYKLDIQAGGSGSDVGELLILLKPEPPATLANITGTVSADEPEGHVPAPGARVEIQGGAQTFANNKSFFFFAGLTPGSYTLEAFDADKLSVPLDVEVNAGDTVDVELLVQPLANVQATVLEAETGDPISGAAVQIDELPEVVPEASGGTYTFRGLVPQQTYTVRASHTGYKNPTPTQDTVTPAPGTTGTATFVLTAKGKISGTVKDSSTSQAIGGASVLLLNGPVSRNPVLTPSNGTYQFVDLPPGTYVVDASHPDYQDVSSQQATLNSPTSQLTRSFNMAPVIRTGTLKVSVIQTDLGTMASSAAPSASVTVTGPTPGSGTTNSSGVVQFLNRVYGSYQITASKTGYDSDSTTREVNQDLEQVALEITKPDDGGGTPL